MQLFTSFWFSDTLDNLDIGHKLLNRYLDVSILPRTCVVLSYYVTCDERRVTLHDALGEKERIEIVVPHSQNDFDLFEQDWPNSNQHGLPTSFGSHHTFGYTYCCTSPSSCSKYYR